MMHDSPTPYCRTLRYNCGGGWLQLEIVYFIFKFKIYNLLFTYTYLKCDSVNVKIRATRDYQFQTEPLWFERITLIISSIAVHKKSTKFTIKL